MSRSCTVNAADVAPAALLDGLEQIWIERADRIADMLRRERRTR